MEQMLFLRAFSKRRVRNEDIFNISTWLGSTLSSWMQSKSVPLRIQHGKLILFPPSCSPAGLFPHASRSLPSTCLCHPHPFPVLTQSESISGDLPLRGVIRQVFALLIQRNLPRVHDDWQVACFYVCRVDLRGRESSCEARELSGGALDRVKKQTNKTKGKVWSVPRNHCCTAESVFWKVVFIFYFIKDDKLMKRAGFFSKVPEKLTSCAHFSPIEEHVMVTEWHLPFYGFQIFVCWKIHDAETSDGNKKGSFSFDEPKIMTLQECAHDKNMQNAFAEHLVLDLVCNVQISMQVLSVSLYKHQHLMLIVFLQHYWLIHNCSKLLWRVYT